jgi:hypothetical protein
MKIGLDSAWRESRSTLYTHTSPRVAMVRPLRPSEAVGKTSWRSKDGHLLKKTALSRDSFTVSSCRDLLLHVQEQHTRIPAINALLRAAPALSLGPRQMNRGCSGGPATSPFSTAGGRRDPGVWPSVKWASHAIAADRPHGCPALLEARVVAGKAPDIARISRTPGIGIGGVGVTGLDHSDHDRGEQT